MRFKSSNDSLRKNETTVATRIVLDISKIVFVLKSNPGKETCQFSLKPSAREYFSLKILAESPSTKDGKKTCRGGCALFAINQSNIFLTRIETTILIPSHSLKRPETSLQNIRTSSIDCQNKSKSSIIIVFLPEILRISTRYLGTFFRFSLYTVIPKDSISRSKNPGECIYIDDCILTTERLFIADSCSKAEVIPLPGRPVRTIKLFPSSVISRSISLIIFRMPFSKTKTFDAASNASFSLCIIKITSCHTEHLK